MRPILFLFAFPCFWMHPFGASNLNSLYQEMEVLNQTVWKKEVEAQDHERFFIGLWDALRNSDDPYAVAGDFKFGSLKLGTPDTVEEHENNIRILTTHPSRWELTWPDWMGLLNKLRSEGYDLTMSEWHHDRFDNDPGKLAHSVVSFKLFVYNESRDTRYIVSGKLGVDWQPETDNKGVFLPKTINSSELTVTSRSGDPFFKELYALEIPPGKGGPLLVHDLNDDGLSEILLPAMNTIFWNLGNDKFGGNPLHPVGVVTANAAILGDFSGDGHTDLLIEGLTRSQKGMVPKKGLFLYRGEADGKFVQPVIGVATSTPVALEGAPTFTSGDIDGDGDLDLWLAQYKELYLEGAMPTPYYDAVDGYPAYLLVNNGNGSSFTVANDTSGIAKKRNRRTFSSSFFDYDNDDDLDLLVVSDFAGVDLYQNDGSGKFTDVTDSAFYNRHLFGMAHTIEDFNHDGLLDLYAIGMSSTTARRLDHMNAGPIQFPGHNKMRSSMSYGNRLYLGLAGGGFRQAPNGDELARSGWSWGVGSLDMENDGDKEIYIANGHFSNKSAKDYCTIFWTDDIYRGDSHSHPVLEEYFARSMVNLMNGTMSWNGFEKNVLFMPMDDGGVRNISYLMGVAEELDSRQVVADDLDGDGRVDLVYSSQLANYEEGKDSTILKIIKNQMPASGNWIGIRLKREPGGALPEGAKVFLRSNGQTRVSTFVTGDSYQAQHSLTKHFGLGDLEEVESVEVVWSDGERKELESPAINEYHVIHR